MKKDIQNKKESENIVLDEESQKDEKKKPTAKKIFGAVFLILLAVVFAVLGFCVVGGAFDCNTKCNVAYADSTVTDVTDFQSQAASNYTLENIAQYTSLYGVFINKSFTMTYAQCVEKDSYFGAFGVESIEISIVSTASDMFYNRYFSFSPVKITNDFLSQFGATFTLSAPVYGLRCVTAKNADDFGTGFTTLIYNDVTDYNNLINWTDFATSFSFGSPVVTVFDLVSIPKAGDTTVTYSAFVPTVSGMNPSMLSFWSKFIYLSLPSIGSSGISQADYDKVVSERDTAITERDNAISEYNDYKSLLESQFSYVPEVYTNPTTSTMRDRVYINKDTVFGVFVVNANKAITDIIDVNGNLILPIKGLNDSSATTGVWQQLFALQGYHDFVSICNIAHLTPKDSTITPKGMICSYDIKNKRLTVWRNVVTFADLDMQTTYEAFGESYEDYGTSVTQADRKATTDGIISVLESPVNFLKTVFNFEIFGINLSAVVFFVVSIVIVAFVIKKVV